MLVLSGDEPIAIGSVLYVAGSAISRAGKAQEQDVSSSLSSGSAAYIFTTVRVLIQIKRVGENGHFRCHRLSRIKAFIKMASLPIDY